MICEHSFYAAFQTFNLTSCTSFMGRFHRSACNAEGYPRNVLLCAVTCPSFHSEYRSLLRAARGKTGHQETFHDHQRMSSMYSTPAVRRSFVDKNIGAGDLDQKFTTPIRSPVLASLTIVLSLRSLAESKFLSLIPCALPPPSLRDLARFPALSKSLHLVDPVQRRASAELMTDNH
jgi:hypothetical protein